jgi:hypothetical protein
VGCNTQHGVYDCCIDYNHAGLPVIVAQVSKGVGLAKQIDFPTLNVFSEKFKTGVFRCDTEFGPASLFILDEDGFGECHILGRTDIPAGLTELHVENITQMPIPPSGLLEIISLGITAFNNRRKTRLDFYK